MNFSFFDWELKYKPHSINTTKIFLLNIIFGIWKGQSILFWEKIPWINNPPWRFNTSIVKDKVVLTYKISTKKDNSNLLQNLKEKVVCVISPNEWECSTFTDNKITKKISYAKSNKKEIVSSSSNNIKLQFIKEKIGDSENITYLIGNEDSLHPVFTEKIKPSSNYPTTYLYYSGNDSVPYLISEFYKKNELPLKITRKYITLQTSHIDTFIYTARNLLQQMITITINGDTLSHYIINYENDFLTSSIIVKEKSKTVKSYGFVYRNNPFPYAIIEYDVFKGLMTIYQLE